MTRAVKGRNLKSHVSSQQQSCSFILYWEWYTMNTFYSCRLERKASEAELPPHWSCQSVRQTEIHHGCCKPLVSCLWQYYNLKNWQSPALARMKSWKLHFTWYFPAGFWLFTASWRYLHEIRKQKIKGQFATSGNGINNCGSQVPSS